MSIRFDVHQEMNKLNSGLTSLIAQGDMDPVTALEHCVSLLAAPRGLMTVGITRIILNDDDKVVLGSNYCVSLDGLTRYGTHDSRADWWTYTYQVGRQSDYKDDRGFMLLRHVVTAFSYEYRELGQDSSQLSQQALDLIKPAALR